MYIQQMILVSVKGIIRFYRKTKLKIFLSQIDVSKLANSLRKSMSPKGGSVGS